MSRFKPYQTENPPRPTRKIPPEVSIPRPSSTPTAPAPMAAPNLGGEAGVTLNTVVLPSCRFVYSAAVFAMMGTDLSLMSLECQAENLIFSLRKRRSEKVCYERDNYIRSSTELMTEARNHLHIPAEAFQLRSMFCNQGADTNTLCTCLERVLITNEYHPRAGDLCDRLTFRPVAKTSIESQELRHASLRRFSFGKGQRLSILSA